MTVEAVLERLRVAYRAPDLAGVAMCLGMDEMTFRVWRSRKKVPDSILVKVSKETGHAVSWLSDGDLNGNQMGVREASPNFFADRAKQVNLTPEEKALLDNFRAASREGRLAIAAASAALAKPNLKGRKAA
jgi:hypothetical protein